ncbi:MAG: pilus assembly protein PilM [Oscillospiraceae bacterium]|nr:pilus assembly protein PilM [Oscillospiraceae bacterium]
MSKFKISGKVLVIQLGSRETHVVLAGKDSSVIHGVTVPTPAGAVDDGVIRNPEAVREMLKPVLKKPEFKGVRQVVYALCTTQVIAEAVTTPDLPESKLEKLLRANMDMYFPVDTKDYHLVWQIIGAKAGGGSRELAVQLWAVPLGLLKRYYTVANECGLSVVGIDYCGHSAATAAGASFSVNKKKAPAAAQVPATDLHILLERDLLGMTFVQNGQVVLQRFVRCGADPTYQFGELAMMLEYFRSMDMGRMSPIKGIASGLLATNDEIVARLSDVMGIPFAKLSVSYWAPWALCVGASHTELDFGINTLNAPGKVRTEIGGQLWQYALILVGGLSILGVVMLTLSARLVWNSEIANLQNQQQTLMKQQAEYAGFADNFYEFQAMFNAYDADWETTFGSLQTYNDNLVLVLDELEDLMPQNSSVVNMQVYEDQMFVEFACQTKEEAAYLIMALREMQYADPVMISDVWGGGNGPATSYGSGTEAPPTEGSGQSISQVITSAMESGALNDITIAQIKALEKAYGKQPYYDEEKHKTVDELKAEEKYSAELRKPAIEEMLTTNPFAAVRFRDMLIEDFMADENAILLGDITLLYEVMSTGWLSNQPTNMKDAQKCMGDLLKIFTKTETRLNNLEKLLCSDEDMAKTYTHYLGVKMEVYDPEEFPYLDLEKMVRDVETNGKFTTEDAALNEKLNALIPEIDTDPTDPGVTDPGVTDPGVTDPGVTDPSVTDPGVTDPGVTDPGVTEPGPTDPGPTEPDVDHDQINIDLVAKYLQLYLTTGKTNTQYDEKFTQYLKEGKTDDPAFDAVMEKAFDNDKVEDAVLAVVYIHTTLGSTGFDTIDDVLDKYKAENTTGIPVLDKKIAEAIKKITDSIKPGNTGTTSKPSGSTGSTGSTGSSGSSGSDDKRLHFIVVLGYSQELKEAELIRKGLSYEDRISAIGGEEAE